MGNMSNRKLSFLFGEIFARGNNNDDSGRNGNPRCGNEEQQERESSSFLSPRIGETRETEKDVRSREVSPYNRLGSLTYAEPPLHAISTTISLRHAPFVCPVPQRPPPPPPLLFRSRCTVAFGLCIIITITASSSWLVVEKPPRILPPSLLLSASPPNFLFFPHASVLRFVLVVECQETRDEKGKEKDGLCSRVCVN